MLMILFINHAPNVPMAKLGSIYRMIEGSIAPPSMYLGANICKWTVQDNTGQEIPCFVMGSHGYIMEIIRSVE